MDSSFATATTMNSRPSSLRPMENTFTRGQRDFSSVTSVVATKYEVLVEHKVAAQARELLAKLPGGRPDPFA